MVTFLVDACVSKKRREVWSTWDSRDELLRWRVQVVPDQPIVFGLSPIGRAVRELPYVIHAVDMMARKGFGAQRASFLLEGVRVVYANGMREFISRNSESFVRPHDQNQSLGLFVRERLEQLHRSVAEDNQSGFALASASDLRTYASAASVTSTAITPKSSSEEELKLRFLTPTRLRIKGKVVEQPSFPNSFACYHCALRCSAKLTVRQVWSTTTKGGWTLLKVFRQPNLH